MDLFARFRIWYRAQPQALRWLLTVNVVFYLLWSLILIHINDVAQFVMTHLALHPEFPSILTSPWQLVTYNFMHVSPGLGGLIHILFNMLWLVWIGRDFEQMHGPHKLFSIYILGGVGGGLLSVLLNSLFPGSGFFSGPIVGASASVLAVLAAVATFYPHQSIGLLFIGNIRLPVLVAAFLFLDLLFLSGSRTAVGAHLGGALSGFLWARAAKSGVDLSGWATVFFRSPKGRSRRRTGPDEPILSRVENWLAERRERREGGQRTATIHTIQTASNGDTSDARPKEDLVNRLLDKISEEGYDALTEEEKRTLYEASRKK